MWLDIWLGAQTGFLIALPVGPVVLLLVRAFLMEGWTKALYSSFFVSLAVALHMCVGCFFLAGIKSFVEGHVRLISFFMGLVVCFVAFKLRASKTSAGAKSSLYYPAVLSLICPFTTTILLSLLVSKCQDILEISFLQIVLLAIGAFGGSFIEYVLLMVVVRTVSCAAPEGFLEKASSHSYLIVGMYGLHSIIKSILGN